MLDELLAAKRVPALRDFTLEDLLEAVERGHAQVRLGIVVPRFAGGSISASDLVFYNSANMTTDSSSTTGGAIDTLRRPDFTQMSQTETVKVQSSSTSDNFAAGTTVTITGRLADGSLASETLSLTSGQNWNANPKTTSNSYERILKVEMSQTGTGTFTISGTTSLTTFRTIPAGERGFQAMFQQLASSTTGATNWYEKIFVKNTNGSLALTSATVTINADPQGVFTFWLAASLNDSATVANRTTAPGGSSFNTGPQNVANSQNLSSGSAQGIWLKLALAQNNAALRSTLTLELDGQTT